MSRFDTVVLGKYTKVKNRDKGAGTVGRVTVLWVRRPRSRTQEKGPKDQFQEDGVTEITSVYG